MKRDIKLRHVVLYQLLLCSAMIDNRGLITERGGGGGGEGWHVVVLAAIKQKLLQSLSVVLSFYSRELSQRS